MTNTSAPAKYAVYFYIPAMTDTEIHREEFASIHAWLEFMSDLEAESGCEVVFVRKEDI